MKKKKKIILITTAIIIILIMFIPITSKEFQCTGGIRYSDGDGDNLSMILRYRPKSEEEIEYEKLLEEEKRNQYKKNNRNYYINICNNKIHIDIINSKNPCGSIGGENTSTHDKITNRCGYNKNGGVYSIYVYKYYKTILTIIIEIFNNIPIR